MSSAVIPLTKLEAVNEMLFDMGERPVSSISDSSRLDVVRAVATLDRITREFCSRGWFFNREEQTITPDTAGSYNVSLDIVNVDVSEKAASSNANTSSVTGTPANFAIRSGVLVNSVDNVSTGYTADLTVEVVRLLEFEAMPAQARAYVYAKASAINVTRSIGATDLVQVRNAQATTLLAELKSEDISHQDYRSTESPRHLQLIWGR